MKDENSHTRSYASHALGFLMFLGMRDVDAAETIDRQPVWGWRFIPVFVLSALLAQAQTLETALSITSFGEDEARELYVADLRGNVYRIETPSMDPNAEP